MVVAGMLSLGAATGFISTKRNSPSRDSSSIQAHAQLHLTYNTHKRVERGGLVLLISPGRLREGHLIGSNERTSEQGYLGCFLTAGHNHSHTQCDSNALHHANVLQTPMQTQLHHAPLESHPRPPTT